tara:strand:- start:389 stop:583 length:195 start_codon:yes stop_codon:yes gene_type:complete
VGSLLFLRLNVNLVPIRADVSQTKLLAVTADFDTDLTKDILAQQIKKLHTSDAYDFACLFRCSV